MWVFFLKATKLLSLSAASSEASAGFIHMFKTPRRSSSILNILIKDSHRLKRFLSPV